MLGRLRRVSKRTSVERETASRPSYCDKSTSEESDDDDIQKKTKIFKRRKVVNGKAKSETEPRPTRPSRKKQNDTSGSSDTRPRPSSCDLIETGLDLGLPPQDSLGLGTPGMSLGKSTGHGDRQVRDDSSSDSSDEFRTQSTAMDLNSDFFRTASKPGPSTTEPVIDFSSIESNILSGVTNTLTDSESEVEYTEVNWPCIPSTSERPLSLPSETTVKPEAAASTETRVVETKILKQTSRTRKRLSRAKPEIKEETNTTLDVLQLLKLGEGSSSEVPIFTKSLSSDDSDNLTDLEEVAVHDIVPDKPLHTIPKEGVQITLEIPELNQKRKKKDFDMEAYLLRRINNRKRAIQVLVHKVSILCWIAHGHHINSILNSELLLGMSLSLIPSKQCYPPKHADLDYMEQILKWFHKTISHDSDGEESKPENLLDSLESQLDSKKAKSKTNMVLLFICILRSLGIKTRLVLSLQPIALKLASQDLCTVLPKKSSVKERKEKTKTKKNMQSHGKSKTSDAKSEEKKDIASSKSKEEKSVVKSEYFEESKTSSEIDHAKSTCKSKYFNATSVNSKSKDKHTKCKSKSSVIAVEKDRHKPVTESKYFSKSEFEAFENKVSTSAAATKYEEDVSSQIPNPAGSSSKPNSRNLKKNESTRKTTRELPSRSAKLKNKPLPDHNRSSGTSDSEPDVKRSKRKQLTQELKTGPKPSVHKESKPTGSKRKDRSTTSKSNQNKITKKSSKPKSAASDSDFEPDEESGKREIPVSDLSSDSDFEPQPTKPPKKWSGEIDRRVLSTDEDESEVTKKSKSRPKKDPNATTTGTIKKKKQGVDIWAEVFLEAEEKWFSIDVLNKKVHCHIDLHAKATQPVLYVVAFNPDLSLKDVTRRYVVNWLTIKQRVNEEWWEKSLRGFLGRNTPQDREEDEELSNHMLNNPLPTVIGEYKNHPLYVLKRHLLKFEAIYPPDTPTLGFVRSEAVYPRECVHNLHSREVWVKEAKVVKLGEKPYKIVKARPKYDRLSGNMITDQPLEVFGSWQLQDYEPPVAEDGKVPRNEYGNVELFKPCMLPKGCAHVPVPGLSRVARKLGIDCAPAMVGFDYHSGGSHPTYDGYVVCEEFKDILLDAWNQEVEESAKRAAEKQEKRVYDNWKRLIKGLLIRERLKTRYSFGEASTSQVKAKSSKAAPTKKTARGKRK